MPGGGQNPETKQQPKEKVCLICIDGWGVSTEENPKGDAIRNAKTPVMSGFEKKYPYTTISAHGLSVGLPDGLMGNSEVGHLNIGAGRVVYQVSIIALVKTWLLFVRVLTSDRLIGYRSYRFGC